MPKTQDLVVQSSGASSVRCPYCASQEAGNVRFSRKPVLVDKLYVHKDIGGGPMSKICMLPDDAANFQFDYAGKFRIRAPRGTYSDWTMYTGIASVTEDNKEYIGVSEYFEQPKSETVFELTTVASSIVQVLK